MYRWGSHKKNDVHTHTHIYIYMHTQTNNMHQQGLKYEKNPATKATITQRVDGYMKRAEDLKVRSFW
jgi:t-SNARE complex subunit (syntaxin)